MVPNIHGGAVAAAALSVALAGCIPGAPPQTPQEFQIAVEARTAFLNAPDSLKFAVIGDFGTGEPRQYAMAERMAEVHSNFPFELVLTVGDNIYGSDRPQDYARKFEIPYAPLLDAGVDFYASLGNHDAREQRFYEHFNMDGELYYTFKAPNQDVRFVALESTYMQPEQLQWFEKTLASASEDWVIVYQHHPLYSSGGTHGSDLQLRREMEPLLIEHGVDVMFAGHDHIYERTEPQHSITHFVVGSSGKLRPGDYRPGQSFSARIVDRSNVFLAVEILDNRMIFNAYANDGAVVDSGMIIRVEPTDAPAQPDAAAAGDADAAEKQPQKPAMEETP